MAMTAPAFVNRLMSRISCAGRGSGAGGSSAISTGANEDEMDVTRRTKTGVPTRSEISNAAFVRS